MERIDHEESGKSFHRTTEQKISVGPHKGNIIVIHTVYAHTVLCTE